MARDAITITTLTENTGVLRPSAVVGVAANDLKATPANTDDILLLMVTNTGAGALDVVVKTGATYLGQAVDDLTVNVAAGATKLVRLTHMSDLWLNGTDLEIDIGANTDLSFWLFKL